MPNEADTCRLFVVPKLQAAGWDEAPYSINEQRTFTDGRIVTTGRRARRRPGKRADYLLRYRPDFSIAVVEAKPTYATPSEGIQQAKDYAEILGLKFAFATNGHGIVEFDFLTGVEREVDTFPTPEELWTRLLASGTIQPEVGDRLLTPSFRTPKKTPRYYQEIAINRAVQAILQGEKRALLTLATGTGKTVVAFQICWKLWNARWNLKGDHRRPRILFLADRNFLVDNPMTRDFAPFEEAAIKIADGKAPKSREMYFAIYQAIAKDKNRPGLYKEYAPDFFDLIIIDECHRGSAKEDSNWREILEYFEPAAQLGMTATPLRADNRDTYLYFGNPLYTYSLRQGIADGFLAPYRVHRVVTTWDAAGWRPSQGDIDRYGREIPDDEYQTKDFERAVALKKRTEAIAKHLTDFMKKTDRFAKTIVFCVDQEHANEMRTALNNFNSDLAAQHSDYVCRVTADEGDIGLGHLSRFQDIETRTPVILTTSQLLTTGLDAPTCQNIVLARIVGSMTEFKQIIGRGTRVSSDEGKLFFNILDYTGSATRQFADPEFDGEPPLVTQAEIDEAGEVIEEEVVEANEEAEASSEATNELLDDETELEERRKFYFDEGQVEIVAHVVHELDPDGTQLRVIRYSDYTGEKVRNLFGNANNLRESWAEPDRRREIIDKLAERGIDFDELAETANQPDADPLDLLCHLAFNAPLRTRRERAERLRKEKKDFFDQFGPEARAVLNDLLDKYTEHGAAQFVMPDVLEVPPISAHGNVREIASKFGGADKLADAVHRLQAMLYAA